MAFAKQNFDFAYWQKQAQPLFADLAWNIPEQKTGQVNIIGGSGQSFHSVLRFAELLTHDFPLKTVELLLPDALRSVVPPLANIDFAPTTDSGSFAGSKRLNLACSTGDLIVLAGDFSRNAATAAALAAALQNAQNNDTTRPLLVMRDAVDLLVQEAASLLEREGMILLASMTQLQKIFRAVYYPRMLMISQPLTTTIETLHKFTLSYPATILTLHDEQIIVAQNGRVSTTTLARAELSVLDVWSGKLAARVAAYNLFNPTKAFEATTAAVVAK